MSDATDHEIARRLYEHGWTLSEIGRDFGVSATTVRRWILPGVREEELVVSRAWKERNKERLKTYDRKYRVAQRKPCPRCRKLMSGDSTLCRECRRRDAETRNSIVVGLYQDGWPLKEIAQTLGTTINSLSVTINRLRRNQQIGYRHYGYGNATNGNGAAPTLDQCSSSPPRCSPSSSSTSSA